MSRAVRTARGAFGALTATVLAAASHSLAGGTSTPIAVAATAVFALPLCVLLAGRVGSLWRLAAAVIPAQFAFHWMFAGIGMVSAQTAGATEAVSPHAAHLGLIMSMSPTIAGTAGAAVPAAGTAEFVMWASHTLAAALTIVLMHWGELAALHLMRVLRKALPLRVPGDLVLPAPRRMGLTAGCAPLLVSRPCLSGMTTRGPPSASFSHHINI